MAKTGPTLCIMATITISYFTVTAGRRHSALASLNVLSTNWANCGFGGGAIWIKCQCNGSIADCSGDLDIPPSNFGKARALITPEILETYAPPIASITHLDVSYNGIGYISDITFGRFKSLKVLGFRGNLMWPLDMEPIFTLSTLEELDISKSYEENKDEDFPISVPFALYSASLPELRILLFDFYNILDFNMTEYGAFFPKMQELHISGGIRDKTSRFYPYYMPELEKLSLPFNSLYSFIDTYDEKTAPFFPKLSYLDLSKNSIGSSQKKFDMRRLPELKTLILDENLFRTLKYTEFSDRLYDYPKLQHLSLIQATISKIESCAFNNPSLLSIDLSRNGLDFVSNDTISDGAFDGCTNLTKLNLEGNVFKAVSESRMERLFASLTSLRVLNLGNTKLDRVDTTLWKSLMNISELYLHDNLISIIPEGTFDDLHQLTVLRLDDNQIRSVTKATFSLETRSRLTSLDLSINPFECTCALLWFRNWVADNSELFNSSNRYSRYECRNLPGKDLHMFLQNQQPCLLGHDAYVLTVVCAALLIVGLTVASQLYRYRWHIRLLLYETFRGKPDARRRQVGAEDFQYDLFVSYDSEDAHWVLDHLMPVLEQQMGLRLCIHQRDFIPGKNIVDNILDCLDSSKRVLAVFSPTFAQSQWCHFELEMCLSHVIDNNDIMVLVMLQHVPSRDMSGAMLALINTTTYIEWGDHPEVRDSFWRRMTLALKDILPALRQ